MATGLTLDPLVTQSSTTPFAADQFSTVEVNSESVPGEVAAAQVDNANWSNDTGGQNYMSPSLTFVATAVSDTDQVVTFNVMNGSTLVTTIYAHVLNWNSEAILFQGFTDPALTTPLPGTDSTFILDTAALGTNGQPANGVMEKAQTPFRLRTQTIACFARGTEILTASGPVAVEALAEGDLVVTLSGQAQAVQWIGSSSPLCHRHPDPARVMPVRVQKDAFGPRPAGAGPVPLARTCPVS